MDLCDILDEEIDPVILEYLCRKPPIVGRRTCRYCGMMHLHWVYRNDEYVSGWRLHEPNGEMHHCNEFMAYLDNVGNN